MTQAPLPWLRLWTDFPDDPRIKLISFDDQRHFIVLLCLKGRGILDSEFPSEDVRHRAIAAGLGLNVAAADEVRRRLLEVGLVNADWQPAKWDQRQYKSDNSAARTRTYRARRHGDGVVTANGRHGDGTRAEQSRADTEQIRGTTAASRPKRVADPPEFETIRSVYPKRGGSQPWSRALKAARARVAEGATWQQLIEGTTRYAEFVAATGKTGTEYVLQAATFFGPDRRYAETWAAPHTKSEARQDRNLTVSQQWLEQEQRRDAERQA